MRRFVLCALLLTSLAACGQSSSGGGSTAAGDDKFAGLDTEVKAWRDSLEAESPVCKTKVDGKGCQEFAVACKRERELTAKDQAAGITARVAAAMTFNAKDPNAKPGSAFAEFTKAKGAWTRTATEPFNLTTCQ